MFSVAESMTNAPQETDENEIPEHETSDFIQDTELSADQKSQFSCLLEEFDDLFAENDNDLGRTDLIEHKIDTGNATPIKQAPRHLPPYKRHVVDEQLSELLRTGRIEESVSPWSSPIVLAKKRDGSYRLTWETCLVYLDDVIIWSSNFNEHLAHLRLVFERLRAAKVKLKRKKCSFLKQSVNFLGHVVSAKGIEKDPEKTRVVREWPTPTSVGEVRSFLGLASYYRRYIPGFAAKSEPLRCLLQKNRQFEWTEQQQKAFTEIKECLVNPPVLAYPSFGPEAGEFILDTDASTEKGIGAVLSQKQSDGTERVIAYGSRSLQPPEQNYCATQLEMLALVEFINHFRYYLLGRCFTA